MTSKKLWSLLSELKRESLYDYATYESNFVDLWERWVASLREGEGALDFLKKDRFIAGLWSPLKEKVKGRFPATCEFALEVTRLKDKKLRMQAQAIKREEQDRADSTQAVATASQRGMVSKGVEDHQDLLNRITSELENLSVHLVEGRGPRQNGDQGRGRGRQGGQEYVCYNCGEHGHGMFFCPHPKRQNFNRGPRQNHLSPPRRPKWDFCGFENFAWIYSSEIIPQLEGGIAMTLFAGDPTSFASCLGFSFLQPQQQALLRNTSIASSPQKVAPFHRRLRQVQCNTNLSPEVSKSVYRLKKQGIKVTPRVLHRVKKKEAWKSNRKAQKEKEKANRVTDPVWYDWPEEQAAIEERRNSIAQNEEDEVDKFLSFVDEARPFKRLLVHEDDDIASIRAPGRSSSSLKRDTKLWERKKKMETGGETNYVYTGYGQAICQPISIYRQRDVTQVSALNHMSQTEGVLLPLGSDSEVFYPWSGNYATKPTEASQQLQEQELDSVEQAENLKFTDCADNLTRDVSDQETLNFYCRLMSKHSKEQSHAISHSHKEYGPFKLEPSVYGGSTTSEAVIKHNSTSNSFCADEEFMQPESHGESSSLLLPNHKESRILLDSNMTHIASHTSTNISASNLTKFRPAAADAHGNLSWNLQSFDTKHLPASKELYNINKEPPTAGIEKFLDDEIQEVPKKREIWLKEVGLVKQRKPPFSREVKERILGVRRGDLSVLEEEEDSEDELSASDFPFDGRAVLVEDRKIQRLAARLDAINYWTSKMHFSRLMHSGKMKLTEDRVIRIIQILGDKRNWRRAMQVVQWVHKRQHYQFHASKFVLTTLLSVLGKARRPVEALNVFDVMRENFSSYPDMAAYHAIATILGQAGQLKELLHLMESLKVGPPKPIKFIQLINWDSSLYPDIVVYNAVLTACISTKEWAGVVWTWEELEKTGIKPNGATFGITIEAMVRANMFDQVVRFYKRMERAGFPPNAQTYKCLVEAFGKERMTEEASELVQEMEASGIVGTASVYFALACSFCVTGKVKEALAQVRRIKELSFSKPDVVTFTGLIRTSYKVGRIQDAIFIFNHMQQTCAPNVRTCNEMIKIFGWNNMFEEAKKVYEGVKRGQLDSCVHFDDSTRLSCDSFTFELMLKAAAVSEQWGYFDAVYWDMTSHGYYLCGRTNQWLLLKIARLKKVNVASDMLHRLRKSGDGAHLRFYEALILSCVQAKRFQNALIYLNDMRIDGYEVMPVIEDLQEQVDKELWDNFLHEANGSRLYRSFSGRIM
ncbi:hypothetical protein L7F22_021638 [Adiantum nelumboides]|nr:hypothetical protein [Adiantum nelumboides]